MLNYAREHNISHQRLTTECLSVHQLDFNQDKITIKVEGFEKVLFEELAALNSGKEFKAESTNELLKQDLRATGIIVFTLLVG